MAGTRRFKRYKRPKKAIRDRQGDGKSEDNRGKVNYTPIVKENIDLIKYYKAQKIVSEEEWDSFVTSLRTDLPTAFRISSCNLPEANKLLEIVRSDFFEKLINVDQSNESKKKPFCLPWYPHGLGWQMELSRKDIRRCEEYFRLHNFLILETETGCISRQETVSMIPPLALDIQSHHKVLDMCAAPGSKTAQLVELLHSHNEPPSGFVVANDIDNSRCYMLVHQAKRLNSPCVVITNHDASNMPNFFTKPKGGSDEEEEVLKFDRVLCDVPCTGDGTLRKNPDIWLKWNSANGNNLHGVQFRVLQRGLEMLEVGGRLVYSTCSFNPVENEAVIQRMLLHAKGSVELVEFADKLPGLKYKRGMTTWLPASRDLGLYERFDQVEEKWHTLVRPQMFPQENKHCHLERCLRILPHHQDTGGFFIAVLTKTALLPWERPASKPASAVGSEADAKQTSADTAADIKSDQDNTVGQQEQQAQTQELDQGGRKPPRKKRRIQGYREDPFVFFKEDEPVWSNIRDFYGVEGLETSCLLTRCLVGKKKNLYYVSPKLRDLVDLNQTNVKIINTGVKVFSRCDSRAADCEFRFVQEGLESIKRFVGDKRRIKVTRNDLMLLLSNIDPRFPPQTDSLNPDTQEKLLTIGQGSCIIDYDEDLKFSLVGWKGVKSLRAYVAICDAAHYLRLIGGDASLYERNKYKKEEDSSKSAEATLDKDVTETESIKESTESTESGDPVKAPDPGVQQET